MRAIAIGILALEAMTTGCGFEPGTGQADGGPGPGDPDAQTIDAMPGVDSDGDGVEDALDNCPSAMNAAQHNEDADDRGDACDACPHRFGTAAPGSDADSDGDMIGDQCDPGPGADVVVAFLPFNDPGDYAAFEVRSGGAQWSVANGKLVYNGNDATTPQHQVWTGTSIVGTVAVETRARVDAVLGGNHNRLVAVTGAYYDGTPVDTYGCGLIAPPSQATMLAALHYRNPPTLNDSAQVPMAGTMVTGAQAHLTLVAIDNNPNSTLNCTADATPATLAVSGYYPEGFPGVRTIGVQASFDYLWVVDVAQ